MSKPFGCPNCGCRTVNTTQTVSVSILYNEDGEQYNKQESVLDYDDTGSCAECCLEFDQKEWAAKTE